MSSREKEERIKERKIVCFCRLFESSAVAATSPSLSLSSSSSSSMFNALSPSEISTRVKVVGFLSNKSDLYAKRNQHKIYKPRGAGVEGYSEYRLTNLHSYFHRKMMQPGRKTMPSGRDLGDRGREEGKKQREGRGERREREGRERLKRKRGLVRWEGGREREKNRDRERERDGGKGTNKEGVGGGEGERLTVDSPQYRQMLECHEETQGADYRPR